MNATKGGNYFVMDMNGSVGMTREYRKRDLGCLEIKKEFCFEKYYLFSPVMD